MRRVLITLLVIVFLCGCATSGVLPTKKVGLTKLSRNCWLEENPYRAEVRTYYFRYSKIELDYVKLIGDLFEISGVQLVEPARYKITVTISKSYAWNEVEPEIIAILNSIESYRKYETEDYQKRDGL